VTNALKILRRRFGPIPDGVRREIVAEFADECRAYREQGMTDIERAVADVKHCESLLKAARERMEAAKAPPKVKTVGQAAAEELVVMQDDKRTLRFVEHGGYRYWPFTSPYADKAESDIRRYIAAAIDKAVADEREACENVARNYGASRPDTAVGLTCGTAYNIADAIRNRK
jgi:hypothetical protein